MAQDAIPTVYQGLGGHPDPPPGESDLYVVEVTETSVCTYTVRASSHDEAETLHREGHSSYRGQRGMCNRAVWRIPGV